MNLLRIRREDGTTAAVLNMENVVGVRAETQGGYNHLVVTHTAGVGSGISSMIVHASMGDFNRAMDARGWSA